MTAAERIFLAVQARSLLPQANTMTSHEITIKAPQDRVSIIIAVGRYASSSHRILSIAFPSISFAGDHELKVSLTLSLNHVSFKFPIVDAHHVAGEMST